MVHIFPGNLLLTLEQLFKQSHYKQQQLIKGVNINCLFTEFPHFIEIT